jgi:putative effector of murein hydrolase
MAILSGMVFAAIIIGITRVFIGPLPLHIHVILVIVCGVVGAVIGDTIIKTLQKYEQKRARDLKTGENLQNLCHIN